MARTAPAQDSSSVALAGCHIDRPATFAGAVEVVVADATARAFPTHVSGGLGICLKRGKAHAVIANGRSLSYPADALCVRAPGCVWSSELAPAGFLSIDIAPALLPEDLTARTMRCLAPSFDLRQFAARIVRGSVFARQEAVAELLLAVLAARALEGGRSVRAGLSSRVVEQARERLSADLHQPLELDPLCSDVGVNKFVLIRQFRAHTGTTPQRYRALLRVERARAELSRGKTAAEVASSLGFADQAHFSRSFKRVTGVSPRQYARRARHG